MEPKRQRFSKVWLMFNKTTAGRAECVICGRSISYLGGATSNLSRHLKHKHPTVDYKKEKSEAVYVLLCDDNGANDQSVVMDQQDQDVPLESSEVQITSYPISDITEITKSSPIEKDLKSLHSSAIQHCSSIFQTHLDNGMDLNSVIKIFEDLIPLALSEPWDNTGLLVEPTTPKTISTIYFTNDLSEAVLSDAMSLKADLIVSYHPPIFKPIKSLKKANWKDRIVLQCIENSIAIYSPHTACDAIQGGVNDWLISCFELSNCDPIKFSKDPMKIFTHCIKFCLPTYSQVDYVLRSIPNTDLIVINCDENFKFIQVLANETALNQTIKTLSESDNVSSLSITTCDKHPLPSNGMGRIGKLKKLISVQECIKLVKKHLHLKHLRVSLGKGRTLESEMSSVAVCAGSGSEILNGAVADLYITGEMSHHHLLDALHQGITVILCEHSNSERGYLKKLIRDLRTKLPSVNLILSTVDKDPISFA